MKKINGIIILLTVVSTINLNSCKKNAQVSKPVETQAVSDLKQFYATTAKVSIDAVKYDASKDEFSINGTAKISRAKLSMFDSLSKNNGQIVHLNATAVNK